MSVLLMSNKNNSMSVAEMNKANCLVMIRKHEVILAWLVVGSRECLLILTCTNSAVTAAAPQMFYANVTRKRRA